jgi:hypothetical protein
MKTLENLETVVNSLLGREDMRHFGFSISRSFGEASKTFVIVFNDKITRGLAICDLSSPDPSVSITWSGEIQNIMTQHEFMVGLEFILAEIMHSLSDL